MSAQPRMPLPDGMTADKLRMIADWLDTYDEMAESYVLLAETFFGKQWTADHEVLQALPTVRGKEVQTEIRAWADALPPLTPSSTSMEAQS